MKRFVRFSLLILTVLLISTEVLAQKIKIKKDYLYIDKHKTPITIDIKHKSVDNMGDFHQIYTFTDTSSGRVFLYVDYKGYLIPGIEVSSVDGKLSWLEISNANRSKTNSVDFEGGLFSSKKKIILALLNEYQLFNHNGVVDYQKINEFMTTNTHSIVKAQAATELEISAELRKLDPYISSDLSIRQGGPIGDKIGRLEVPENHNQNPNPNTVLTYRVYDLDENLIASASTRFNFPMVKVSLIDEIRFEYRTRFGLSSQIGGASFLEELLEQLIMKGYHLGHHYNEINILPDMGENAVN